MECHCRTWQKGTGGYYLDYGSNRIFTFGSAMLTMLAIFTCRRLGLPDSQSLHLLRPDLPFSTLPITSSGSGTEREGTDSSGIPSIPPRHGVGEMGSQVADVVNINGN